MFYVCLFCINSGRLDSLDFIRRQVKNYPHVALQRTLDLFSAQYRIFLNRSRP